MIALSRAWHRASGPFARRGRIAGAAALMAVSSVFAQGVSFLAYPMLTRLYSPEAFGYLGVWMSVVTTCMVFAALRLEYAIPIPRSGRMATATAVLAGVLTLVSAALLAIALAAAVWIAPGWLAMLSGGDALVAAMVPIGILAVTGHNVLYFWAIRQQAFGEVAVARIVQSMATVAVQIGAGLVVPGASALVAGYLAGRFAGAVGLARLFARTRSRLGAVPGASAGRPLKAAASRYRGFPVLAASGALLESASFAVLQGAITAAFGAAVSGFYLLSQQTINSPVGLVFGAIAGAFYGRAGQGAEVSGVARLNLRIQVWALLLFCGPASVLFPVLPAAFRVVYGEPWAPAGLYAQLLLPALLTNSLSTLTMLFAARMQWLRDDLLFNLAFFVARLSLLAIGVGLSSPVLTMALLGIGGALTNLVYAGWFVRRSGLLSRRIVRGLAGYALLLVVVDALAWTWGGAVLADSPIAGCALLALLAGATLVAGEMLRRRLLVESAPDPTATEGSREC